MPVLLAEVIAALKPHDDGLYLDGTFGAGGYTEAMLRSAACRVVALDRDPTAIARGEDLAKLYAGRLTLVEGRFSEMERLLAALGITQLAGVALDLGVSSMQIDDPTRGFSFRADGPLDMRMGGDGRSAADLVNSADETELAALIRDYGEERFARRIARAIVAARPLDRTSQLAAAVRSVVPDTGGIDPATRTFQALRIAVNEELDELDRGLAAAERLLEPGGRIAVVAFHSLEDRRVKDFLRRRSTAAPQASRHAPATRDPAPSFTLLTRKPLAPSAEETARNPRARSARLRAAERTTAPAWEIAA
ncbi:MAG TPA: 16S rRNA (cytosine(1402)-N(4))-methyltransferase RsmH [Stellaceae bacterium]|nr:16S rRNA (cytosine(1402)-N(4))-methyltransferase RsmH [Stellaceae bacterium]